MYLLVLVGPKKLTIKIGRAVRKAVGKMIVIWEIMGWRIVVLESVIDTVTGAEEKNAVLITVNFVLVLTMANASAAIRVMGTLSQGTRFGAIEHWLDVSYSTPRSSMDASKRNEPWHPPSFMIDTV